MIRNWKLILWVCILLVLILIPCYKVFNKIYSPYEKVTEYNKTEKVQSVILQEDAINLKFKSNYDNLSFIDIMIGNNGTDPLNIEFQLKEVGSDSYIHISNHTLEALQDISQYRFEFPKISNSKDKEYELSIKNKSENNDLIVLKNSNNDIDNSISNNLDESTIVFNIVNILNYPNYYKVFINILLFILVLLTIYAFTKFFSNKIQKNYLLISLIFGISMVIFFAPLQSPDEIFHFFKTVSTSKGDLTGYETETGVNTLIPKNINLFINLNNTAKMQGNPNLKLDASTIENSYKLSIDDKVNAEYPLAGTSSYSPIQYIPQSIGVLIGRLLNLNVIHVIWLGRLFNLLFWVICTYISIKIIPTKKKLLFLICLAPVTMQQVSSFSPDGVLFSISILLTSYIFYLNSKDGLLENKERIFLLLLIMILSTCKYVYFPFAFLLLILKKDKFKNKNGNLKLLALSFLGILIVNFIWLIAIKDINSINVKSSEVIPKEQILFVLKNPITYCKTLILTFNELLEYYLQSMVGSFGSFDSILSNRVINSYYFIIAFLALVNVNNEKVIKQKSKLLLSAICFIIAIFVITSMYVGWTVVGGEIVEGVQGRYFYPLFFPILLILSNVSIKCESKNVDRYLFIYSTWIFAMSILTIISRYYLY